MVESRGSLLSIRKAGSEMYLFEEGKEDAEAEGTARPGRLIVFTCRPGCSSPV